MCLSRDRLVGQELGRWGFWFRSSFISQPQDRLEPHRRQPEGHLLTSVSPRLPTVSMAGFPVRL